MGSLHKPVLVLWKEMNSLPFALSLLLVLDGAADEGGTDYGKGRKSLRLITPPRMRGMEG